MTRLQVLAVMAALGALAAGIDVYLLADGIPGNTFSEVWKWLSLFTGTLSLAYGVIGGHLTWYTKGSPCPRWVTVGGLGIVLVLSVLNDLFGWHVPAIVMLVMGLPLGRLLWPQRAPV